MNPGTRKDPQLSVDAGPQHPGRTREWFQGQVSADSDFQQRSLRDICWVVTVIQGLGGALIGTAGAPPPSASSGQESLPAELSISDRVCPQSRITSKLLRTLAEESTGAVKAGEVMGVTAPR